MTPTRRAELEKLSDSIVFSQSESNLMVGLGEALAEIDRLTATNTKWRLRIDTLVEDYERHMKDIERLTAELEASKAAYDALPSAREGLINTLAKELAALRAALRRLACVWRPRHLQQARDLDEVLDHDLSMGPYPPARLEREP